MYIKKNIEYFGYNLKPSKNELNSQESRLIEGSNNKIQRDNNIYKIETIEFVKSKNFYRKFSFFVEGFFDWYHKNKVPDTTQEVSIDYPVYEYVENKLRAMIASKRNIKETVKPEKKKIDSQSQKKRAGGF